MYSDGINWADADCHYGDHFYRKPNGVTCTNCGQTNYQLLSYFGYRARMAKKAGISVESGSH